MFHQEDITVKIFNGEMKNLSWEQFFTYTQKIFAEAAAGARTYENYFGISEEVPDPAPKENPEPAPMSVLEHDVHPEPEIAPAQPESEETAAEPMTRKEYIDTLTAYGTAEYIAKAMRIFSNKTYNTLLDKDFWNEWLTGKVDHNGRPWEE